MKLLLTSAGITNPSTRAALLELLGRPIAECRALPIKVVDGTVEVVSKGHWRLFGR